ncbi:MAG: hypothetical protein GX643_03180 [Acidimicrobiales bacterium]|nr:hypothetical protein [Acidimicrobiales bacterium]
MELFLGDALLTFDGSVVESFGTGSHSAGRFHVGVLAGVEVSESRRQGSVIRFQTIWGGTPLVIGFGSDQRAAVELFADEVRKALVARRG